VRQAEAYKSALLSGAQLYSNMKFLESHMTCWIWPFSPYFAMR
jgi:hypothetical protein